MIKSFCVAKISSERNLSVENDRARPSAAVSSPTDAVQLGVPGDVRGAVVIGLEEGSPAAAAGLREGEVIVALGGTVVRSPADVSRALARLQPGAHVSLDVVDSYGPRRVGVVLARRPATLR